MAPLAYATLGGVKRRLNITDTTDDAVLADIIADVNQDIEDMTGRAIGPATVTDEYLDGYDALEDGMCLQYPRGVRTVTKFEIASGTGETFTEVPTTDILLRPLSYLRQPDWPAFEIWMTDAPSATNTTAYFPGGYSNIRMSASVGWAAIPSTLVSAAEITAQRTFLSNRSGHTEGDDELGERVYRALWRGFDIQAVRRYAWKGVEII